MWGDRHLLRAILGVSLPRKGVFAELCWIESIESVLHFFQSKLEIVKDKVSKIYVLMVSNVYLVSLAATSCMLIYINLYYQDIVFCFVFLLGFILSFCTWRWRVQWRRFPWNQKSAHESVTMDVFTVCIAFYNFII